MRVCTINSCGKPHKAQGMCSKHYARLLRHGDPNYVNPKCNRDGKYLERKYQKVREWKKNNWPYYKAYLTNQKKHIKRATPPWVDKEELIRIYQNCPKGYHVDHIQPLHGKISSGLHVPWNLQYLLAKENLKKSNKENYYDSRIKSESKERQKAK